MKKSRWLWRVGTAALLLTGCAAPSSSSSVDAPAKSSSELPGYVFYVDTVLLRWADKVIHVHGLTDLPTSSLMFLTDTAINGDYREIEVRENHRSVEHLDPDTAPRLFTLRINLHTAALTTDATHIDGRVYPFDGKFRTVVPGIHHPQPR